MSQIFYMKRKTFFMMFATSLFLVLNMLTLGTSFALDPNGKGDAKAITSVAGEWMAIQPGEAHWYKLDYKAQRSYDEDDGTFLQPVSVWMETVPHKDNINFSVWTEGRLSELDQEQGDRNKVSPIGSGGVNEHLPGNYYWVGHYYQRTTFYIVVENTL